MAPGEKQRLFLDYLNSAFRKKTSSGSGTAGALADRRLVSIWTGGFPVGDERVVLNWILTKSSDGRLIDIEVTSSELNDPESKWKDAVQEFVTAVLKTALEEKREQFFRRILFHYIGAQLDGEYRLPGFRFAPAYPEDPEPSFFATERVVCIDLIVKAIDENDASALAHEAARRHAARLSLLLNVGLYVPDSTRRWVIPQEAGQPPVTESRRYQLGFLHEGLGAQAMPPKGKVCKLGEYAGSLSARYREAGRLLSLPPESRKILRGMNAAPPQVAEAFDRGARLYQVAAVVRMQFPSVAMAYRVAAVEAISRAQNREFRDFVRQYVQPADDLEDLLDYLYGSVRSAHFHGGEFPLGEHAVIPVFDPFMDPEEAGRFELQGRCNDLIREAIIRWMSEILPEVQQSARSDDTAPH